MNKRIVSGVALVAAFGLVLSGCARADEAGGGGVAEDGGQVEHLNAAENQMNYVDEDGLGHGGTLRLYNNAYPANFNFNTVEGYEKNTNEIMEAVWPQLYAYTADGQVIPNDLYTQRIEQVGEEPFAYEIELVEGLTWSDGTPLDWTSVKNNMEAYQNEEFNVVSRDGYDRIEEVTQGDNEQTAVITFKEGEVYADWIGLSGVMPDALVESAEEFNTGWVDGPKVTAGPYTIENADRANQVVTLVPDENWTGARDAKLDRLSFQTIEDPSAAATAFNNGQLDVIDASAEAIYSVVIDTVDNGDEFEIRTAAGPDWSHFTLNGGEGNVLSDPNLREAFFYAINRADIFMALNGTMPYPEGIENDLLGNHMLMSNQDGYESHAGEYGTGDADRAKELIEEAGWELGDDGFYQKDGEVLEIRYVYNAGSAVNGTIAPIATENLQAAGIKLTVEQVPPTDLFSQYVIPGDYDITMFGWSGNPFVTSSVNTWLSDGEQNFTNIGSEELDDLLNQLTNEADVDKQTDLMNQIDEALWGLHSNLPLYQSYDFIATPVDLANYGAPGFANIIDWSMVGYVDGSPHLEG